MELTEKEVDEIDEYMDQHMYGHSIGNSPNIEHENKFVSIRRCDYKCRKQAIKTAIEQTLSKREASTERSLCRETLNQYGVTYYCSMLKGHDENFHEGVPLPVSWAVDPVEPIPPLENNASWGDPPVLNS